MSKMAMYWFCGWKGQGGVLYAKGSDMRDFAVLAPDVVISQTHWLVSQERLSPRVGTSVFIEYSADIWWVVVLNSQLVYHTTLLPYQGALASTANFKYSEYFYNN